MDEDIIIIINYRLNKVLPINYKGKWYPNTKEANLFSFIEVPSIPPIKSNEFKQ